VRPDAVQWTEIRSGCKKTFTRREDHRLRWSALAIVSAALMTACGGSDTTPMPPLDPAPPAVIDVPYTNGAATTANPVAYWNKIGTDTINVAATPGTGTPEEQRPGGAVDLATLHVAIYDAVMAIVGTHEPFATTPTGTNPHGASQEAAVAAAAYGVLKEMFPNRSAQYQGAYDSYLAELPDGDAKTRGLAIGAEVATGTLALRANDGRSMAVNYTPGTAPGKFRGANPIGVFTPRIKPFTLADASQFRAPPPPALDSPQYAADLAEVLALGGATSATRTPEQLEIARFHTESPTTFLARNYRAFAVDGKPIADNARVMAMLWVTMADATIACFETKYYYEFWRPVSAINLADTDGNLATVQDVTWTPSVPTPNHPEYPSAHLCVNGAAAIAMKYFFGTHLVNYSFGSTVTGAVRQYSGPDAFLAETTEARILGGMHFRNSNLVGRDLGTNVGEWVATNYFRKLD